jgi:hypothetical protein
MLTVNKSFNEYITFVLFGTAQFVSMFITCHTEFHIPTVRYCKWINI